MPENPSFAVEEVTCREFVELVTDYLEDAVPSARLPLIEEHLVMCDWCKDYLEQIDSLVGVMPKTQSVEEVPTETKRVLAERFARWREQGA